MQYALFFGITRKIITNPLRYEQTTFKRLHAFQQQTVLNCEVSIFFFISCSPAYYGCLLHKVREVLNLGFLLWSVHNRLVWEFQLLWVNRCEVINANTGINYKSLYKRLQSWKKFQTMMCYICLSLFLKKVRAIYLAVRCEAQFKDDHLVPVNKATYQIKTAPTSFLLCTERYISILSAHKDRHAGSMTSLIRCIDPLVTKLLPCEKVRLLVCPSLDFAWYCHSLDHFKYLCYFR